MASPFRAIQSNKWLSLSLLALCGVAALSLWFSATAVIPALEREAPLGSVTKSLFTGAVQIGFVVGSLASALLGLADRLDPRRFFMASALVAAAANAAILLVEPGSPAVVHCRFWTGVCMAGIYPVGMKLAATWAKTAPGARADLGLLVGLLVGAVTLGSALPHLFNAWGGLDWRPTVALASLAALAAGLAINLVGIGPRSEPAGPFRAGAVLRAWRDRPLRLANIGYLGHMWELYAMWAWIGLFLNASFALRLSPAAAPLAATLVTFATIAVGTLGCLAAGVLADRLGRTTLTIAALAVSGTCALAIGFLFGGSPVLITAVCLIWGIAIVADSAQFSASVAELAEPRLVGTMLTVQTALGFLLTMVTIHLVPELVALVGWRYAFAPLALGPLVGIWAMAKLRADPASLKLAGGRR